MSIAPVVFLVDDEAAVRKALSRLLGSAGFAVEAYAGAQDFLESGNADAAGCLILDLAMAGMNGIQLHLALAARASLLPVIFLTGHGDINTGVQAMKSGAFDFMAKPVDGDKLLEIVGNALEQNLQARVERAQRDDIQLRLNTLTPREREVLYLLVEGLLNKQIGAQLGTVEKTVKVHRARVMAKMQVRSLTALVRLVDRLGKQDVAGIR